MAYRKVDKRGRSQGEHSAFLAVEAFMMRSEAWQSLGLPARSVYLEIGILYDRTNNGRLALSARQVAERMPVSRSTATRAFQELIKKGFIEVARPSAFNMKSGERRATEWRLTRYKCDVTGQLPTKAYMKWKPDNVQNAASSQGHRGFTTGPNPLKKGQNGWGVALS